MKNVKFVIGLVFLLLLDLYVIVTGISELAATDKQYTKTVCLAVEILDVEHSISGLIPLGHDHYYFAVDKDGESVYVVKGPKNWLDKEFDSFEGERTAVSENGIEIHGETKKMSYDVSKEISGDLSTLEAGAFPLGRENYLDLSYKSIAVKKIIGAVLLLALGVAVVILKKMDIMFSPSVQKIIGLAGLVAMIAGSILIITSLR